MIKTKNGKVTMKGEVTTLLTDYSSITKGLVDALEQNGIQKEVAVEMVQKAHRLGLMTKEEFEKDIMEKIGMLLKDVADKLQRECEEEEKTNE